MSAQTIRASSKSITFQNSKSDSYRRSTSHFSGSEKSGTLARATCQRQNVNSAPSDSELKLSKRCAHTDRLVPYPEKSDRPFRAPAAPGPRQVLAGALHTPAALAPPLTASASDLCLRRLLSAVASPPQRPTVGFLAKGQVLAPTSPSQGGFLCHPLLQQSARPSRASARYTRPRATVVAETSYLLMVCVSACPPTKPPARRRQGPRPACLSHRHNYPE